MKFKKHKVIACGIVVSGALIGCVWSVSNYIKEHVPYFVRSNGLKYTIHYLQGKDAVDEIYTKLGM